MLILVGASASGKTEIAKKLQSKYHYSKCITTTTRSMRIGEVQDKDYHFISQDQFLDKIKKNEFVEFSIYNGYYYGLQKKDIVKEGVLILEPEGANHLHEMKIPNLCIVFVTASKSLRHQRMIKRQDDADIIQKRLEDDDKRFDVKQLNHVDLIIENNDHSLDELAKTIHQKYQKAIKQN